MAIGLVASACSSPPHSTTTTTGATTATPQGTATTTTSGSTHLQSLIPAPANSQRTDGPDSIHDNGIHTHFLVNGSPTPVMDAYKSALEGSSPEGATAARPTSMPAHGRQSPRTPTAVTATDNQYA
jgi:hypothetical protein